jgi:hypothetical protein
MDVMQFKSVSLSDDTAKEIALRTPTGLKAEVTATSLLHNVIKELVVLKPNWRFVGTDYSRGHIDDAVVRIAVCAFDVMEDGEFLGKIYREYARNGYKIKVENHRIAQKRQRGGAYTTDDPKKAIVRIKRTFGRKDVDERVTEAANAASDYVGQAISNHSFTYRNAYNPLTRAATDYAMGEGFPLFMQFVRERMPPAEGQKIIDLNDKAASIKLEMKILEGIRDRLGTKRAALLIRDMGQYIVRVGDNVQLYDDNTLPVEMRGKLGLLKLVEKEHFIDSAGCRVSEDVFVVVLDEEASPNNVNQGE